MVYLWIIIYPYVVFILDKNFKKVKSIGGNKMYENKRLHLSFIQGVINRIANNSILIKGWCITLVVALTALSSNTNHILTIAYVSIAIFCFVDAYYLWRERLYRSLYDIVRKKDAKDTDFSMNFPLAIQKKHSYCDSLFSVTIMPFYVVLLVAVLLFIFYL